MPESRELAALRKYLADSGLPHRVTSTTGGKHADTSRHFQEGTDGDGLALDAAGLRPGDVTAMKAIFDALGKVVTQLNELYFWGGGVTKVVRRRRWIVPSAGTLGRNWRELLRAHQNHVHVSVDRGVFVRWPEALAVSIVTRAGRTGPLHDYEETQVKSQLVFIGPLDDKGRGWSDWQLNQGRDPIVVGAVQQGPSPPDDGYWETQEGINLSVQPRGGVLRVVVRGGKPGDTVGVYVSVA